MEYIIPIFIFILGLLVGSFLSVLVHRFGFNESKRNRSECSSCHKELSWFELFPVLSFLFLKGKCGACGSSISKQDPFIEIGTGVLFLLIILKTPVLFDALSYLLLLSLFIFWSTFFVLTVYDIKHTLIPMSFAIWLILSAVIVRVFDSLIFNSFIPLYDGVIAGFIFAAFILLLVLITKGKGMGVGDVYVAGAIGVVFGIVRGFEVIAISFWFGAIIGVLLLLLQKVSPSVQLPWASSKLRMKSEVPFVPFLFFGALLGAFTTFSPLLWFGKLF